MRAEALLQALCLRPEAQGDAAAIAVVTETAFRHAAHTNHREQDIITALRRSGQLTVSLVAEAAGEIVGHVAVSPVSVVFSSAVFWPGTTCRQSFVPRT